MHRAPSTTPAPHIAVAKWAGALCLGAVLAAAGMYGYGRWRSATRPATLTIETSQAGANVFIGGKAAGRTPLALSLAAGRYDVEVRAGGATHAFATDLAAGTSVVRTIELTAPPPDTVTATGVLSIQTDPSRLAVSVDGVARGTSPLRVENLAAGAHEVTVAGPRGTIRRSVTVQGKETVSLIVSTAAGAETAPGWLQVTAPIVLQLRENGRVIGTTESDRLMLPSGRHEIEVTSPALNFSASRRIEIAAGKTTATHIEVPNGVLNLNAQPWAEVWVDGTNIGQTPLGNIPARIGQHEVIFRHPELGERRETIVVKFGEPARLGVDLRKR